MGFTTQNSCQVDHQFPELGHVRHGRHEVAALGQRDDVIDDRLDVVLIHEFQQGGEIGGGAQGRSDQVDLLPKDPAPHLPVPTKRNL